MWQNSFCGKVARKKKNGRPAGRGCLDEVGLRLNWVRLRVRVGFGFGLVSWARFVGSVWLGWARSGLVGLPGWVWIGSGQVGWLGSGRLGLGCVGLG